MEIDEVEELDCSKIENSLSVTLDSRNYFLPTRIEMTMSR